jgi:hypothetical protein
MIENRWTAICRGAVIHATSLKGLSSLSVNVQARIVRASYGIALCEYWCPKKHNAVDKFWHDQRQAWMAKGQMRWFIKIVCLSWSITDAES